MSADVAEQPVPRDRPHRARSRPLCRQQASGNESAHRMQKGGAGILYPLFLLVVIAPLHFM